MADRTRQGTDAAPNRASDMEKAEGSRENVENPEQHQPAAGITNRPLEEEQDEQENLPPRGTSKDGSHA